MAPVCSNTGEPPKHPESHDRSPKIKNNDRLFSWAEEASVAAGGLKGIRALVKSVLCNLPTVTYLAATEVAFIEHGPSKTLHLEAPQFKNTYASVLLSILISSVG